MRRKWLLVSAAGVLALLACGALAFWVLGPTLFLGYGEGSPAHAQRWKEAFEGLPDPETAQSQYPEVVAKRYANEEWIFGVCEDSHSSPWGGTVVVKDSRGQVRAFFGHVCGSRALEIGLQQSDSLDDFYHSDWLRGFGFAEHTFP